MPRVLIECPDTGKQVYTGVNLNWETFESYRFGTQTLPCPECGSGRLRWRHEPRGRQTWICWGCHITGDSCSLIQLMEQVDTAQAVAIIMAGYVGGDAPQSLQGVVTEAPKVTMRRQMPWPREAEPLTPMHGSAWSYVMARGITAEQVREYGLGVGLRGRLQHHVIFPVVMDGGLVYWQGRAAYDPPKHLDREQRKVWVATTGYRKTMNPTSEVGYASAREVLFNFDRARGEPHVVICEGPVDAIKVGPHAVALLGKNPSEEKVQRLLRLPASRYTVYLDRGEQERASALALAAELSSFAPTFIATPPEGCDPGQLSPAENAQVIAAAPPFSGRHLVSRLRA